MNASRNGFESSGTKVKICGVTSVEDAALAANLGAFAVGLNFYPRSPRFVSIDTASAIVSALPADVQTVGVFVDATAEQIELTVNEARLQVIQLHGNEPPSLVRSLGAYPVIRAFRWQGSKTKTEIQQYLEACSQLGADPFALLLDAYQPMSPGGTGAAWNWAEVGTWRAPKPLFLAGGLNPSNVAGAMMAARPFVVDVASGVESAPGRKSPVLLEAFFAAVAAADDLIESCSPEP